MILANKNFFALFWLLLVTMIGGAWCSSEALARYIAQLQKITVSDLNQHEQKA